MSKLNISAASTWRFVLKYLELLLALVLAVIVGYLSLKGEIHTEELTQATVALLVAIAIAVVRERTERESLVTRMKQVAELAKADRCWRVLDERLVWDLSRTDGSYAKATAEKELQFMQDEVFSIYEYQYKSPGRVLTHVCEGGVKGEPMATLPIIQDDFPGLEGRVYRLISLQRIWRRGEVMAFRSERELENHFLGSHEDVAKEVSVPTARLSMRVVWPAGKKPTALWLERSDKPLVNIPLVRMRQVDGRWSYEEAIRDPRLNEKIILKWDW
jgi:hypothetical protein